MPDVRGASAVAQDDIRGGLPVGTVLGGYELISILGKGGFGITYRARDFAHNQDVAIKEYLPTALAIREGRTTVLPISTNHAEQFAWGRERFLEEARTLERLDHAPAVVRVLDFLEANGTAYMVMALVEGETLNKRLMREQRLAPEVIERLLFPLLDGLEQVHAIGFLHRDIKPANIMVDPQDRPTLIDFGASRAAMAGRSTTLTAIFTPGYAAAEQFVSSKQGPWTDIYGLAATLYHAITGRIPPSAVERIMQDAYQPLSDLRPSGYASGILAAIDAAMAVRADDRPQTIAEWRRTLRFEGRQTTQIARKLGLVARAARRTRRGGITIKGRALGAAVASALVLLAGGGYLAWMANAPTTVSTAALSLSAEQLEQALAERRKADDLVAEKRRLEVEARQKAVVDAEAKRQADAELEQARQARQKAEQELAQLKTDTETRRQSRPGQRGEAASAAQRVTEEDAQRKAEAQTASLRQAEEEAANKAAADAEAKRQADEALAKAEAERQRAEADARAKAEAETAARRQTSEEDQRKAEAEAAGKRQADEAKAQAEREKAVADAKAKADAEAAERALRLESADRERLQVALTSLGFDTRGSDGLFGPRSREMIAAWQKKAVAPATGFLTAAQRDELLRMAAPAVARWEEERKKAEEQKLEGEKKKSDTIQATPAAAPASGPLPAQAAAAPQTTSPTGVFDGTYTGGTSPSGGRTTFALTAANGRGSLTMSKSGCNFAPIAVTISPAGEINGQGDLNCPVTTWAGHFITGPVTVGGRISGERAALTLFTNRGDHSTTLDRSGGGASPAPAQTQPNVASTGPSAVLADGTYRGSIHQRLRDGGGPIAQLAVQMTNGSGTGTVTIPNCGATPIALKVGPSGNVTGEYKYYNAWNCDPRVARITGQADGGRLTLDVEGVGRTTLTLGGAAPASPPAAAPAAAQPGVAAVAPAGPSASPDGLWRGTYSCTAVSSNTSPQSYTLDLQLKLANGTSSGGGVFPNASNNRTMDIHVSVSPPSVTVTRTSLLPGGPRTQNSLTGQFDGTSIRASGRYGTESLYGATYDCTLTLTRA